MMQGVFLVGSISQVAAMIDVTDLVIIFLTRFDYDNSSVCFDSSCQGALSNAISEFIKPSKGCETITARRQKFIALVKEWSARKMINPAEWSPTKKYRGLLLDKISRRLINTSDEAKIIELACSLEN